MVVVLGWQSVEFFHALRKVLHDPDGCLPLYFRTGLGRYNLREGRMGGERGV
jgi:hypothetical protein